MDDSQRCELGNYEVTLISKDDSDKAEKEVKRRATVRRHRRQSESVDSGEFRVEEFRVPLMKGTIQPPKEPQVNVSKVDLKLGIHYLAGGSRKYFRETAHLIRPGQSANLQPLKITFLAMVRWRKV